MQDSTLEDILLSAKRHLDEGRFAEAEQDCHKALSARPNQPDALMLGASVAVAMARYPRAEYLLNKLLQRQPDAAPAFYLLATAQSLAGQRQKAVGTLSRGFQIEYAMPATKDGADLWRKLLGFVVQAPADLLPHALRPIRNAGQILERAGIMRQFEDEFVATIAGLDATTLPQNEILIRTACVFGLLGFDPDARPDWNRRVFEDVAMPWMQRLLDANQYPAALQIESWAHNSYVQQSESQKHFSDTVRRWVDPMRMAGKRFADSLPSRRPAGPPAGNETRIAFFVHHLTGLAHIRLLVDVLTANAEAREPLYRATVYTLKCSSAMMLERLDRANIDVIVGDDSRPDTTEQRIAFLSFIRAQVAERRISALVWISNVVMMPFAFGMRLAPVQIWWAMKYHGLEFPEIDGYLTGGSVAGGFKRIGGHLWRAAPVAAADWFDPALAPEAAAVRGGLPAHRVVFGTLGREEKLNSLPFLGAVAAILKAVPDAIFLWTGRERHAGIQRQFEDSGVADRCVFIGWVNTKLYAQVIDVFLDSFPFPCGYTVYEAMAAAKPVVLYASAESETTGIHALLGPLLGSEEGSQDDIVAARALFNPSPDRNLYLRHSTEKEYCDTAVRLANEPALRSAAGSANLGFVAKFMSDRDRVARIYAGHLMEILGERSRESSLI